MTGIIYPLQQKLQYIVQSLGGPSEHISSDQVEQLEKKDEEVSVDVSWVQQVLK